LFDEIRNKVALNAYITVSKDQARVQAEKADPKRDARLTSVAIAVKDNISTAGIRTTCGSKLLEDYVPTYDAGVVSQIVDEGAIVVGKTNMDEFGMGSSTEFSAFGPTRNPYDESRVPGGSSGGSAAAVAAGIADVALGSDTGGSIRCPASFCGLVGLKPTYGLVSRFGLVAYGNSLEQIGPITKTVRETALLLDCITQKDPRDATSVGKGKAQYIEELDADIDGIRIGIPSDFFGPGTDGRVTKSVWKTIHALEEEGALVEETQVKSLKYSLPAYYIIAMSEASSNLARFDGLRYGLQDKKGARDWSSLFIRDRSDGFGSEVKRRIIMGTFALSAGYIDEFYLKAQRVRTIIRSEFEKLFKRFDALIGPTMPTLPFKVGEKTSDPLAMYMTDIDTVPANMAGLPAISVPCGSADSLPIGLQIMAPPFREDIIFKIGSMVEKISSWRSS